MDVANYYAFAAITICAYKEVNTALSKFSFLNMDIETIR